MTSPITPDELVDQVLPDPVLSGAAGLDFRLDRGEVPSGQIAVDCRGCIGPMLEPSREHHAQPFFPVLGDGRHALDVEGQFPDGTRPQFAPPGLFTSGIRIRAR